MLQPKPPVGLRYWKQGLWEVVSHTAGALLQDISTLKKETLENLAPFHRVPEPSPELNSAEPLTSESQLL